MSTLTVHYFLFWGTGFLLMAIALGGTIALARVLVHKSANRTLLGLALAACVAALFFAPLYRHQMVEHGSWAVFVAGLPLVLILMTAPLLVSMIRLIRTRSIWCGISFLMCMVAVALFFINLLTEWIWPFSRY